MCELLGLSFAEPVSADFSIRPFSLRDEENADGWGMAWYPDRSSSIVKEPLSWRQSQYARFLATYKHLDSRIHIAHMRKRTTGGDPVHADTHPFSRELCGRSYTFAHNGTLAGFEELPLGRFFPIGNTDSEHVFCHLLDRAAGEWDNLDSPESWSWLHERLSELNPMGRLNCLLSDGKWLFCYRDRDWAKGLNLRRVSIRGGRMRRLEDDSMEINLEGEPGNHGVVVATRPLSHRVWHAFRPGELVVLRKGRICHSSHRRIRHAARDGQAGTLAR
jgi:predicted glutamine amidotransferase